MGDLVHAFLWLAREPAALPAGLDRECFTLGATVAALVNERRASAGAGAVLELTRGADALVDGSERLARVVIGNVLGNALSHGDGAVELDVDGARLVVRNAARVDEARAPAEGFGFGLQIARELCARFGWAFETREHDGVFTVVLDFAPRSEVAAA
jgi:signal transduction histidine kinase